MKRTAALLTALCLLLTAVTALTSCANHLSDDEARAVVSDLVEKSYALNTIFFGKGMVQESSESRIASYLEATHQTREKAAYLPVMHSSVYQSEAALEEAALAVYSEDYTRTLMQVAFDGVADGDDDQVALGEASVIYARYLEQVDVYQKGDRVLCVRVNLSEDAVDLAATAYRYDTLKVTKSGTDNGKKWVKVTLDCDVLTDDGSVGLTIPVSLTLVLDGAGWRLDTPTYVNARILPTEDE